MYDATTTSSYHQLSSSFTRRPTIGCRLQTGITWGWAVKGIGLLLRSASTFIIFYKNLRTCRATSNVKQ